MKMKIILAFLLLVPAVLAEDHPYCLLSSCPNRTHTFCKYPEQRPGSACGNISMRGLSEDEKITILDIYNSRFRPSVSIYEELDSSVPPSAQPNRRHISFRMFWDDELEEIAQRWADQCTVGQDQCRNSDRFLVRQRTHFSKDVRYIPEMEPIAIRFFQDDLSPSLGSLDFSGETMEDAVDSISKYFSALVRLNENKIGCGAMRTYDDDYEYFYVVCNYGISVPENIP